jgi:hypothetical protein
LNIEALTSSLVSWPDPKHRSWSRCVNSPVAVGDTRRSFQLNPVAAAQNLKDKQTSSADRYNVLHAAKVSDLLAIDRRHDVVD